MNSKLQEFIDAHNLEPQVRLTRHDKTLPKDVIWQKISNMDHFKNFKLIYALRVNEETKEELQRLYRQDPTIIGEQLSQLDVSLFHLPPYVMHPAGCAKYAAQQASCQALGIDEAKLVEAYNWWWHFGCNKLIDELNATIDELKKTN